MAKLKLYRVTHNGDPIKRIAFVSAPNKKKARKYARSEFGEIAKENLDVEKQLMLPGMVWIMKEKVAG